MWELAVVGWRVHVWHLWHAWKRLTLFACKCRDGDGAEGAGNRTSSQVPQASQKLGPKANQGAINAGLRALDRSGAPCRRWELKGCQLKSFTGVVWNVPSWKAPPKPATETASEDATVKDGTSTSSDQKTDHRPLNGTGAISEKSNSGADADTRNPTPSQHPHETPSSPPTTSQQQQKRHSPSVPQSIEVSA